ncbi:MAG: GMP synthase [Bacteroidota bacterium]
MKLGLLTTDRIRKELVGEFGEYPDMFSRLLHEADPSLELINYYVLEGEYPEDIDEVDAYLITGSSHSVYEALAWIQLLGEFIKRLHERKKKMVGICFGHQLVAHVLGGETAKAEVGWNIGTEPHQLNQAGEQLLGKHDGFQLLFSHQDQIVEPAEGSVLLASTPSCPIAMCSIGEHLLTIQGHPEFEKPYLRELMDMRRKKFGEELYQAGVASLDQDNDRALVARWIIEFIQKG